MYNVERERDRGRQVELPLHSHYISGIKAKKQILDYISDVNKTFCQDQDLHIFSRPRPRPRLFS